MELDEIIYTALMANQTLKTICGWKPASVSTPEVPARIYSTCIEVPPTEEDKTPLPYLIIVEEPSQNGHGTKDNVWESGMDIVNVGVIISATSPKDVKNLRKLVRAAIGSYVESMTEDFPYLRQASRDGTAWDWMKPCYYDILHYQCDMNMNKNIDLNDNEDEQD